MVPGDPNGSLLISAVNYQDLEMPPNQQLDAKSISVLNRSRFVGFCRFGPKKLKPSENGTANRFALKNDAKSVDMIEFSRCLAREPVFLFSNHVFTE